jgi:hypothetical protein
MSAATVEGWARLAPVAISAHCICARLWRAKGGNLARLQHSERPFGARPDEYRKRFGSARYARMRSCTTSGV